MCAYTMYMYVYVCGGWGIGVGGWGGGLIMRVKNAIIDIIIMSYGMNNVHFSTVHHSSRLPWFHRAIYSYTGQSWVIWVLSQCVWITWPMGRSTYSITMIMLAYCIMERTIKPNTTIVHIHNNYVYSVAICINRLSLAYHNVKIMCTCSASMAW